LYSYCRSMLREPAGAADAVQETFLVATARLRQLRDRRTFRPWLYALARNECLRRLRAAPAVSGPRDATESATQAAELDPAAEPRALLADIAPPAVLASAFRS